MRNRHKKPWLPLSELGIKRTRSQHGDKYMESTRTGHGHGGHHAQFFFSQKGMVAPFDPKTPRIHEKKKHTHH